MSILYAKFDEQSKFRKSLTVYQPVCIVHSSPMHRGEEAFVTAPFRYAKIGYVALTVTDLDRSTDFYSRLLDLEVSERTPERVCLRCSSDHHNVVLSPGPVAGLNRVGFQLESEAELDQAWEHFRAQGLDPVELDAETLRSLRQERSFRVKEPVSGLTMEYYASMLQPARAYQPLMARIARLGHVLIGVKDYDAALKSFTTTFGFRVSDHTPGHSAFLRCFPNPFHHSFGLVRSEGNQLHHVNFMVSSIDDVGRAMNRLKEAGVEVVFGPGRHFSSGSIFLYFLDPDGLLAEYSFEMEQFPEVNPRQPRMLERSRETADLWGGVPTRALVPNGPIL